MSEDQNIIYKQLREKEMSISELSESTSFSKSKLLYVLKDMIGQGFVDIRGNGRGAKYCVRWNESKKYVILIIEETILKMVKDNRQIKSEANFIDASLFISYKYDPSYIVVGKNKSRCFKWRENCFNQTSTFLI